MNHPNPLHRLHQIYAAATTGGHALDLMDDPGIASMMLATAIQKHGRMDKAMGSVLDQLVVQEAACELPNDIARLRDEFTEGLRQLAPLAAAEFPDYDLMSLPAEVVGDPDFVDASWHNDIAPSWIFQDDQIVFIDFPTHQLHLAEDPEVAGTERFSVTPEDDQSDFEWKNTNSWTEALEFLRRAR